MTNHGIPLTDQQFDTIYKFIHDELEDLTIEDWEFLEDLDEDNVDYIVEMKQASWYEESPC